MRVPPHPTTESSSDISQSVIQDATTYPWPQTQHDRQPPGRTKILNRDHSPSEETSPIPSVTPLTIRPRSLHYINSGIAWNAKTFCRPRHKGYERLGDAFTIHDSAL